MEQIVSMLVKILEWIFFITAGFAFIVTFIFFYGFTIHLYKRRKRRQNRLW
jgi:cbb3-type cytochrome oxidase subunit 3